MSEIPDWIEQGMFVRSEENEGMFYNVDDIAESEVDNSRFLVLSKVDNRDVKETMYDWEFEYHSLVEVQAADCPCCGENGEIKLGNLNVCYNSDCDVAEHRGEPVDVDSDNNVCEKDWMTEEEREQAYENFVKQRQEFLKDIDLDICDKKTNDSFEDIAEIMGWDEEFVEDMRRLAFGDDGDNQGDKNE